MFEELQKDIEDIKARNQRVEADKAWERSPVRILSIAAITYVVATLLLYFIGVPNFFLTALVPTVGYYLSTQSLSVLKKWWTYKYNSKT
jgi:hypothetical protein